MHVGWTSPGVGVLPGLDDGTGPSSVHGTLMDYEEVQLAGDGELFIKSPYLPYRPEDTRVINYMLARMPTEDASQSAVASTAKLLSRGWRQAHNVKIARAEVVRDFGEILEENAAGDHVFFRVYKERK